MSFSCFNNLYIPRKNFQYFFLFLRARVISASIITTVVVLLLLQIGTRPTFDHVFSTVHTTPTKSNINTVSRLLDLCRHIFSVCMWLMKYDSVDERREKNKIKQSHHIETVSQPCVRVRRELTTSCCFEASRGVRLDVFCFLWK